MELSTLSIALQWGKERLFVGRIWGLLNKGAPKCRAESHGAAGPAALCLQSRSGWFCLRNAQRFRLCLLLPSFRLEEQTKKLQKDMKKSTDADLGT